METYKPVKFIARGIISTGKYLDGFADPGGHPTLTTIDQANLVPFGELFEQGYPGSLMQVENLLSSFVRSAPNDDLLSENNSAWRSMIGGYSKE